MASKPIHPAQHAAIVAQIAKAAARARAVSSVPRQRKAPARDGRGRFISTASAS